MLILQAETKLVNLQAKDRNLMFKVFMQIRKFHSVTKTIKNEKME